MGEEDRSPAGYFAQAIAPQMGLYSFLFNLVDWASLTPYLDALGVVGAVIAVMMGVYLIGFALSSSQVYLMTRVGTSSLMRLRNEMFDKLQKLPVRYFDETPHGDIMSRFTNDVDALAQFFNTGLMEIFTSVVMLLGIVVFIFMINWLLASVTLVMELIAVLIVSNNVHRSVSAFSETQVSMGEFNGFAEEVLSGLKVVKCFSKEDDMARVFKSIDYWHTLHNRQSVFLSSCNVPIVNNINNMTTGLVVILGAVLIVTGTNWGFTVTIGSLISYVAFLRMLARPFNSISNLLTSIQSSLAGAERIFQMMDLRRNQAFEWPSGNPTKAKMAVSTGPTGKASNRFSGMSGWNTSTSPTAKGKRSSTTSLFMPIPARRLPSSAQPVPGRRRSPTSSRGSMTSTM